MYVIKQAISSSILSISIVSSSALSACDPQLVEKSIERTESFVTTQIAVDGMVCGGCESVLESTISKLNGVSIVKASHKNKTATVTYNPKVISVQKIVNEINQLGYKARA